jgi:hypothetical protein
MNNLLTFGQLVWRLKGRKGSYFSDFELLLKYLQQCTSEDSIIQRETTLHMGLHCGFSKSR